MTSKRQQTDTITRLVPLNGAERGVRNNQVGFLDLIETSTNETQLA